MFGRKRKYLKMMSYGQITDEKVAKIFNTSVTNVRMAFAEYSKSRNPFRQRDYKFLIEIISILLVLFTLIEMNIERNNAYLPDIYFNNTVFIIGWDKEGTLSSDSSNEQVFQYYSTLTDFTNEVPQIKFTNVGMETAKYVHIEWDHSNNMKALSHFFVNASKESLFSYEVTDSFTIIKTNNSKITTISNHSLDITYMKNESQEEQILLPLEYWECIKINCYNGADMEIPDLKIRLRYSDIQGKEYHVEKIMKIVPLYKVTNLDNSGYAVFEVREIGTNKIGLLTRVASTLHLA
ncbi:MAG: hypothetical protein ACI3WQ_02805 [Faecousia sp.]